MKLEPNQQQRLESQRQTPNRKQASKRPASLSAPPPGPPQSSLPPGPPAKLARADLHCNICNVEFDSQQETETHNRQHAGAVLLRLSLFLKSSSHVLYITGSSLLCSECQIQYKRPELLAKHMKRRHGVHTIDPAPVTQDMPLTQVTGEIKIKDEIVQVSRG